MPKHEEVVDGATLVHRGVQYRYLVLRDEPHCASDVLTDAEREVALRVARGASPTDIARTRSVSRRTIENQLACVYRKLGIGCRRELIEVLLG